MAPICYSNVLWPLFSLEIITQIPNAGRYTAARHDLTLITSNKTHKTTIKSIVAAGQVSVLTSCIQSSTESSMLMQLPATFDHLFNWRKFDHCVQQSWTNENVHHIFFLCTRVHNATAKQLSTGRGSRWLSCTGTLRWSSTVSTISRRLPTGHRSAVTATGKPASVPELPARLCSIYTNFTAISAATNW